MKPKHGCLKSVKFFAAAALATVLGGTIDLQGQTTPAPLIIKVINARSDIKTNKVYITPNMGGLNDAKNNPMAAASTLLPYDVAGGNVSTLHMSPGGMISGRIYFSLGSALPGSDVAPTDPGMGTIRYDYIELTVYPTNDAADSVNNCADLSSVDQCGIPMSMTTYYGTSITTGVGWQKSFNALAQQAQVLAAQAAKASGIQYVNPVTTNNNTIIRICSPKSGAWIPALTAAMQTAAKTQNITVQGVYNGSPIDPTPCKYDFSGTITYDASTTTCNASLTGGFTDMSGNSLATGCTMTATNMSIGTIAQATPQDPSVVPNGGGGNNCVLTCTGSNGATRNYNDNDRWFRMFNDLVTGFNTGLWGLPATNNSSNWQTNSKLQFTAMLGNCPAYSQYSALIHQNSDSYGDPFSDNINGGHVLVNLAPLNAQTLVITLLDDNKTGGYNLATMKNYQLSWPASFTQLAYINYCGNYYPVNGIDTLQFNGSFPLDKATPVYFVYTNTDGSIPPVPKTQPTATTPHITLTLPSDGVSLPGPAVTTGWNATAVPQPLTWGATTNTTGIRATLALSAAMIPINFGNHPQPNNNPGGGKYAYTLNFPPNIAYAIAYGGTIYPLGNPPILNLGKTFPLGVPTKVSFLFTASSTIANSPVMTFTLPKSGGQPVVDTTGWPISITNEMKSWSLSGTTWTINIGADLPNNPPPPPPAAEGGI